MMLRQSKRTLTRFVLLLSTAVIPIGAMAESSDWSVTTGLAVAYVPDYEGSDDYDVLPLPVIDITYGNFFLGRKGLGYTIPVNKDFSFDLALTGDGGRDQDENSALRGLGDVDATLELGISAEYSIDRVTLSAGVRQDILGEGHEGALIDLGANVALVRSASLIVIAGTSTTWASDSYMETYFGINAQQAARSGRARYNAEAGFKDVGLNLFVQVPLDSNWSVGGFANYTRLLGDAADSPIVDRDGSDDQGIVAAGFSYKF